MKKLGLRKDVEKNSQAIRVTPASVFGPLFHLTIVLLVTQMELPMTVKGIKESENGRRSS